MTKETKLHIEIGPRATPLERAIWFFVAMAGVLTIPTFNEMVLNGHWALHLFGALFGLLVAAVIFRGLGPTSRRFETKEAAAEWVRSGEWDRK